jgi:hypothetical protein
MRVKRASLVFQQGFITQARTQYVRKTKKGFWFRKRGEAPILV